MATAGPPLRKRRDGEEVVVELLDYEGGWYPVKRFDPNPVAPD